MKEIESLSAHQRRSQIVQQVQDQGTIWISELIDQFGVSDTTIRRDLNIMEERGQLQRIHGGAIPAGRSSVAITFQAKFRQYKEEKYSIGEKAASLVKPGDSIILDSGTTTLEVALALKNKAPNSVPITVVTNSIPIILELMEWSEGSLNVLGGILLPEHQATVGPQTIANLRRVQVDKAIIGCDGLTVSHGLTTPHMLVAEVGRVMVEVARRVIVVTDSSKLGRVGFTQIVPLHAIHTLITDQNAPYELVDEIRESGIEVLTV